MKKMLQSKMKDVPAEEQEKLLEIINKNPELFKTIAAEAQEHMKQGKDQMSAIMAAVQKHEAELRKLTS